MSEVAYANTRKQPLDQHLFAVGYVAYTLASRLVDDKKLQMAVFVAGCLHDIGKLDPEFQRWLRQVLSEKEIDCVPPEDGLHIDKGQFTFEKHASHNEISLLMYHLLNDEGYKRINKSNKDTIKHVIYWHHAKRFRKPENEFKSLDFIYKKIKKSMKKMTFFDFVDTVNRLIDGVNAISRSYSQDKLLIEGMLETLDEDALYELADRQLPGYKTYPLSNDDVDDYVSNIKGNAKNNVARTAVITADRLVSALTSEQLSTHITNKTLHLIIDNATSGETDLTTDIEQCLEGFKQRYPNSDRNTQQTRAAQQLTEVENVGVLNGPAGCGKTKIALEWAVKSKATKIIWVCPRVQVCQGLFLDLTSDDYLPNTRVEINTSEFTFIHQLGKRSDTPDGQGFSGDVVITTIDQIINTITTHRNVTNLVDFMYSHVVFDEFHEYINMPAFNLFFAELVQIKKQRGDQANTLLVSATPNYYFVENLLAIDRDDIIGIDSFNQSRYNVQYSSFDETITNVSNPFFQPQPPNTFVISNTATTAQLSFIAHQNNENGVLLHSKFKKADKLTVFESVFDSFKQGGSKHFDVLRSGPAVQASLNITCDRMITEFTHAENWLQRLGRLDRFGENTNVNEYVTAIPSTLIENKQSGACARFLTSLNCLQSAKAWYFFLNEKLPKKSVTVGEVYQLYRQFYDSATGREAVEEDLLAALRKSAQVINIKVHDPLSLPSKKTKNDNNIKIKKNSLRGDSRFVQMAVCEIKEDNTRFFPDVYAYPEGSADGNLTSGVAVIEGYGDSAKNLLAFMAKKHHNIKSTKKAYNDNVVLNNARNAEMPIYLSYTPEDLKHVEARPHVNAIYYAVGIKQPIGVISINSITQE